MAKRVQSLTRTAVIWGSAGIGFNITQRALDFLLDDAFKHVSWLAWLAS
jgi:uncharacterized membrane protein YhiD involved in acid resistance